ncbi:MAG: hypothetical protein JW874_04920 [Spirochaetales bacterium]|nr:hypothetical protein [Spirochaetales bacterium]
MKKKNNAILLSVLLIAACSSLSGGNAVSKAGKSSGASGGLTRGAVALPTAILPENMVRDGLKKAYGKPLEVLEEKRQNVQAPEYEDSFFTWVYSDVAYTIYRSGYDGKESLLSAKITGKKIRLPNKLQIGLERSEVYTLLGFPYIEDDISMIYYVRDPDGIMTYEYWLEMDGERISGIQVSGFGF